MSSALPEGTPTQIGPFTLIQLLGEGAMGRVYRAWQDPPAREVALKVLRPLRGDSGQRFAREARVLAALEHPGIARIYASGVTEAGPETLHWLAMEWIRGETLTTAAASLPQADRLRLMVTLSRAVHYAHTRGVIHRDLKPANLLVDASGQPRVLDFGIAHVVDEDLTQMTVAGQVLGTLPYMAPEQFGAAGRVDPRVDVYALGVITYELLTGSLPLDGLASATLAEAVQIVLTQSPRRLSQRLPSARGDLETIVMKALAADPARRYGSAAEFASDLERFLERRPIEARPPTATYVLGLFMRRHRGLAAALSLSVVALLAAAGFSTLAAYRETQARVAAEASAAQLEAVNRFMTDMLLAADPEQTDGDRLTLREVLDRARDGLAETGAEGHGLPEAVRAELHRTLSRTYLSLGDAETAEAQARAALAAAPPDPAGTPVPPTVELVLALNDLGRAEDAREALAGAAPPQTPQAAVALTHAWFYTRFLLGEHEQAEQQVRAALRTYEPVLGRLHPDIVELLHDLALVLEQRSELQEAYVVGADVLERRTALHGAQHPKTLYSRLAHANHLRRLGRFDEALVAYEATLAGRTAIYGEAHPNTLAALNNYVGLLIERQDWAGALPQAERLVAGARAHFGEGDHRTLISMNNLGSALEHLDRYDEAEAIYQQVIAGMAQSALARHPESLPPLNNLGRLALRRGRPAEARGHLLRAHARALEIAGEAHHYTAVIALNLARAHGALGEAAAARTHAEAARAVFEQRFGAEHPRTREASAYLDALDAPAS